MSVKKWVRNIVLGVVAFIIIIFALIFIFNRAALNRWGKNIKSSMNNGLKREIVIYNVNGQEMLRYVAKMDFTYDAKNNMLEYIDAETGKKNNIFLGQTATMIIRELE